MITPDKFKLDPSRVNLYFDKWKYKFTLPMENIYLFKNTKSFYMFERIVKNEEDYLNNLYVTNLVAIKNYISWVEDTESHRDEFFKRISQNQVDLYTNSISIIQDLIDRFEPEDLIYCKYYYAKKISDFKYDAIYLKFPKNKYRLFIKSRQYSTEERKELGNFLKKYSVLCSPSLLEWINRSPNQGWYNNNGVYWAWNHFHFDFDNDAIITMLALTFDNIIGRVCTIEKR